MSEGFKRKPRSTYSFNCDVSQSLVCIAPLVDSMKFIFLSKVYQIECAMRTACEKMERGRQYVLVARRIYQFYSIA